MSSSQHTLPDRKVSIYRSIKGAPDQNMRKVLELAGGIENIIGSDDVVVIKPNLQWWNQGAPNIAACATLIDCIMNRPGGFSGEVVIGENTHRGKEPWKTTGWNYEFARNADIPEVNNYNSLCAMLKKKYNRRFSVAHWIDVSAGGKRVYGPQDGAGYVYCDGIGGVPLVKMDNGCSGALRRDVIMSYPIFITDNETMVDFKNGIWKDGSYTGQPVKFINLAALNHHSSFCGMTGSVKNYFGVVDLSNGSDPYAGGKMTQNYYNFHSFAFDHSKPGPAPGIMGREVGLFMKTIRRADLNITTAEWTGIISRTELPTARTHAILASVDPVALDFHAAEYLLYSNSQCRHHDPEWEDGPLFQYLSECAKTSGCTFNESYIELRSFDFQLGDLRSTEHLPVHGRISWGNSVKMLLKYMLFRFGSNFLNRCPPAEPFSLSQAEPGV